MKKFILLIGFVAIGLVLAACGGDEGASGDGSIPDEVTIGYFPNIDHAAGMVAEEKALYEEAFPEGTEVKYQYFPDGATFMTALAAGEIEGGIVGPGPAMNHFTSGSEINVVAGGASGGTVVMVSNESGIEKPEDLAGKTFITPGVGCTHDVQFETMMSEIYDITSDRTGGEMKHVTGEPATYHSMFLSGQVDAAAVPEPWASVMEEEGSGKPLFEGDEVAFNDRLPASVFVTSQDLVENNPELVQSIVDGHKKAIDFIEENPDEAKNIVQAKIKDITGQGLSDTVVDNSWERINFTYEIDPNILQEFADSSYNLEFLKEQPNLEGLVNTGFIEEESVTASK
ncbi:aliphatic sulfonate ABC transporter substrate-binding protein [Oceanobacillus piezotolerans]|uniref:Aliphatic sulfonate ABC transporter substrate-binding protein n=1 Tax=Oceanobacillus piezotolerans TaxID=2448030 RepID=A0A498D8C1_9BACI|nr:aliphatic sulfonate ABC transporter substrate-binding protein [Oceanobacillus piezotolerans]RLL46786.1 aliphatic sulfonate ABC transporter substrate-binding protein [Oceanobacillus piezotolerans]